MFSPKFYAKLDPSYRKAVRQLESKLDDPKSEQAQKALHDLSGKFMIPQELWNLCENKYPFGSFFGRVPIQYFLLKDIASKNPGNKYYDYENGSADITLHHLSFPHKDLENRMRIYETQTRFFISRGVRQRHEQMKVLYSKIKAADGNIDRWFEALLEANDHQFICDNVEQRLGADLTDKKLWKKYIDYLWENDFKLLLQTYSKYCRFFINDSKMKKEYRLAAVQSGRPVFVPWRNPYDFEYTANEFWEIEVGALKIREPVLSYSSEAPQPRTIHFDGRNAYRPQFPFLSPTIRYILENANAEVLRKLFKACKWFYAFHPVAICHKFVEYPWGVKPVGFKKQSIVSINNSILDSNLDQIFILNDFFCSGPNPNALSNLIPRIYRCTAKYVKIYEQNLSLKNLQFLIGNVVDLHLRDVHDSDGSKFKPENILQFTPKIKSFILNPIDCTADTSQKLSELEFQTKLDNINFIGIKNDLIHPLKFAEFVKKHCSSTGRIRLCFDFENGKEEYIARFRQVLGDAIDKPKVYLL